MIAITVSLLFIALLFAAVIAALIEAVNERSRRKPKLPNVAPFLRASIRPMFWSVMMLVWYLIFTR